MKNMVTSGDYAGSLVVGGGIANTAISLGLIKKLPLNSTTVESYEVLGGTAGAIMKSGYQVKNIFKDGKKNHLDIEKYKKKANIQISAVILIIPPNCAKCKNRR